MFGTVENNPLRRWVWGCGFALLAICAAALLHPSASGAGRQEDPRQIAATRGRGPRADEEVLRRVYQAFLNTWKEGGDWKAFFAPDAVSTGYTPAAGQRSLDLASAEAEFAKVRLLFPEIEFRVLWSRPAVAADGMTGVLVFEQETRLANRAGDRRRHRFIGVAAFALSGDGWQITRLDEYHLPEPSP